MTREYNTRSLAFAIEKYFEVNENAVEVLIFKGRKHLSVKRHYVIANDFLPKFRRLYER